MPVEKVVAKISVLGAKRAVDSFAAVTTGADEMTAALDRSAAAMERMGVAAPAIMKSGSMISAQMAAAAKTNTAAQTDSTAATEAAILAAKKKQAADAEAAKSLGKATLANKTFGKTLSDLAANPATKTIAKWGLGAGALGVYEGIKQYTHMTTAMTQLVTQAQLSPSQLPGITQGALEISSKTGLALTDVANQLYRLQSANVGLKLTNKELLNMGKNAADLAVLFNTAPGVSTEQLARLFGSITVAGSSGKLQGVGTPRNIMALLNATIGAGDIRGTDLVGALGRGVLQSGEALHAKLPDILTWIALSTKFAANASTSGTLIAHSLNQIATPSAQGAKAEAIVGIAPGQLRQMMQNQGISYAINFLMTKMKQGFNPNPAYPKTGANAPGAASALQQLINWGMPMNPQLMKDFVSGHLTKNEQTDVSQYLLTKIFGGARQEIPILTLAENQKLFKTLEADIMKHASNAVVQKDLQMALNTPGRQIQIARQNLDITLYHLGKLATPLFIDAMKDLAKVGQWFTKNPGALKATLIGLTSLVVTASSLYVGGKIVRFAKAIGELGAGIWKLVSAPINGLMKLFGLSTSTAATTATTTEFASAVSEFAAAVEKFTVFNGNPFSKPTGVITPTRDAVVAGASAAELPTAVGIIGNTKNFLFSGRGIGTGMMSIPALGEALNWMVTNSNPLYGTPYKSQSQAYNQQAPGAAVGAILKGRGTAAQKYLALEQLLASGHGYLGFAGQDTGKNPHPQAWWDAKVQHLMEALGPAGSVGAYTNQMIHNSFMTASRQMHSISSSHQSAAAKHWEIVANMNKDAIKLRHDATQQERMAWADGAKGQTAAAKAHEAAAKKLSEAADKLNNVTIQINASQIADAVNKANGTKIARTLGSYGPGSVYSG